MKVCERVRKVRKLAEISAKQASFVARLKSQSHFSLIENGSSGITVNTAEKLAKTFGISLDWLILGKGKAPTQASIKKAVFKAQKEVSK